MKQILFLAIATSALAVFLTACGENTTVNINTNRLANQAGNAVNTTANMAGNAVNAISNTASAMTTPSAENFLKETAQGGLVVVQIGTLAGTKSQNADIKALGKAMAADHGKVNAEVKALAAKKNITLPTDVGSHKSTIDSLTKATTDFDKEFVAAMVDGHEDAVAAFRKQADSSTDADVKAFAAKTLPTLKAHLEKIKAIQAKMK